MASECNIGFDGPTAILFYRACKGDKWLRSSIIGQALQEYCAKRGIASPVDQAEAQMRQQNVSWDTEDPELGAGPQFSTMTSAAVDGPVWSNKADAWYVGELWKATQWLNER